MRKRKRLPGAIMLPILSLSLCCCGYVAPDRSTADRKPTEPLYEDPHILEMAWQLRDISVRAIEEADTREARGTPVFEPLGFTTSGGLRMTYRVGRVDDLHHHEISLSGREDRLTDDTALHLLHFTADLLGVEVSEALRQGPGRYRLVFDLDAAGETAVIENAATGLDQDDILRIWKEAVLNQVSIRPLVLRKTAP